MSNYKFTLLVACALVAVLAVSQTTFARQALIETKATEEARRPLPPAEGDPVAMFYAPDSPIMSCLSDAYALPSSSVYVASPWDMSFRQLYSSSSGLSLPREQMLDLNGDGLVDYQYVYVSESSQSTGTVFTYKSCVYLNTGSGFERVHQCQASVTESNNQVASQTYKGDCAG